MKSTKEPKMTRSLATPQTRRIAVICTVAGSLALGLTACGSSGKKATGSTSVTQPSTTATR